MDASSTMSNFEDEAEAESEGLSVLLALETQLWLELDSFLQRIAVMQGQPENIPIPKQLVRREHIQPHLPPLPDPPPLSPSRVGPASYHGESLAFRV